MAKNKFKGMKISKIKTAFDIAQAASDNVHMIGPHGIGKTEIVKEWAKANDIHLEVLQLPILETSDLIGMPDIKETEFGKVTTFAAPEWMHRLQEANKAGKHCAVFMDELGRASIDIRQASLQIVLEKKVNEHALPEIDGIPTLCIVGDNPSDDYDTAEFDAALEDRFQTYDVKPDIADWLKYARKNKVFPVVTDYLAENPEKLHWTSEDDGEKGSSPRAWKKLSDGLKANTDTDFVFSLINSKVGKTVGRSFYHWFNNYVSIVKPEDILKNIGKADITTEAGQKKAAKKLEKLTKEIEVISAQELAQKIIKGIEEGKKDYTNEMMIVYLASIHLENAAAILKAWKDGEKNETEFYYGGFLKGQPNKWLIRNITSKAV